MSSLQSRLKKYRHHLQLTLQEVSDRTGIPVSTYKEWENGRQIRGEPYLILAELYQVSLQELLTGEKSKAQQVFTSLERIEAEIQQLRKDLIALF